MRTELEAAQHDFRYAAINQLYPGLVTAHLVDVPRKKQVEITAYLDVDSQIMRLDAAVSYEGLEHSDDITGLVVDIIDLYVQEFKEKSK